jgi:Major Facilitator Superfamily
MMSESAGEGGPVEPHEPSQLSQRRTLIIIGALLLGMLLAALDQTIVATALPTIAGDLHGLSHLSWVITAYLLASTVSTPLWGKLGDLYGRKAFFESRDRHLPHRVGARRAGPLAAGADRVPRGAGHRGRWSADGRTDDRRRRRPGTAAAIRGCSAAYSG